MEEEYIRDFSTTRERWNAGGGMETLYLRKLTRKTKCLPRRIFLVRIWPELPYKFSEFRGSRCCRSWKWYTELKEGDCFEVYTWSSHISKCPLPLHMANSLLPSRLPCKAGKWDGRWREPADWRTLGQRRRRRGTRLEWHWVKAWSSLLHRLLSTKCTLQAAYQKTCW